MTKSDNTDAKQTGRQIRLDHIMEVLELAGATMNGILPMDVIAKLGIPSSTAYRILGEMQRAGMLEVDNELGLYRLTWRILSLGTLLKPPFEFYDECAAVADDLGVTIFVVEMRERVIFRLEYARSAQIELRPGKTFPIHASAAGKILWSYQPESVIKDELKRPHTKFQPNTLTTPEEIQQALVEAKAKGYGINDEEMDKDVFAMALPLFAGRRIPPFAVGMMAMKSRLFERFDMDDVVRHLRSLQARLEAKISE